MSDSQFFKSLFLQEAAEAEEAALNKQIEDRITSLDYIACILSDSGAMGRDIADQELVEQMRDDININRRFENHKNVSLDYYDAMALILGPSHSDIAKRAARIALLNLVEEEVEYSVMRDKQHGQYEDDDYYFESDLNRCDYWDFGR